MIKTLCAAAATALFAFGAADAAVVYATDIDWQNNGTVGSSNDRDNPLNALGATDGKFTALGLSDPNGSNPGFAVFSFGGQTFNGAAADIIEVTFNCRLQPSGACSYPESVAVYYGTDYAFGSHDYNDLADFTFAGELFNGNAQGGTSITIPGMFTYIALIDTSAANYPNGPSTDGFDIDSVSVNPVPVPGAAVLMGSVLLAGAARRRKKA